MKLKKIYDEPSFDLVKLSFSRIMDGDGDDIGGEQIRLSGLATGAGGGAAGGGD